jgi:hypothetical protein
MASISFVGMYVNVGPFVYIFLLTNFLHIFFIATSGILNATAD